MKIVFDRNCTTFNRTERNKCIEISLRQSSDIRSSSRINRMLRTTLGLAVSLGKKEHASVMHRLSKKALLFRFRCVKRLKDVALNKLHVRTAGATRGAVEERVANNFRTVVYLRSFSTFEKETAQHRTSIFLFASFSLLFCALSFRNVIYGAWRNSFRFLGLRTTEFTTPDVLTSSFLPLTPGPHRPPISIRLRACPRLSFLAKKKETTEARIYTYIRVRSG